MFTPRFGLKGSPQKNRNQSLSITKRTNHLKGWFIFFALGQGYVQSNFVSKLYLWGKKLTVFPQTHARFWVNLQTATTLTRKPANLRMGKGKGSRAGAVAKISSGATLLGLSWLRFGRIPRIFRRVQVRCNFKIGFSRPTLLTTKQLIRFKAPKRSYLLSRMYELRSFFRKSNQNYPYVFVGFLFKWFRWKPKIYKYMVATTVLPESLNAFSLAGIFDKKWPSLLFWGEADDEHLFASSLDDNYDVYIDSFFIEELGANIPIWYAIIDPRILQNLEEDITLDELEFDLNFPAIVDTLNLLPSKAVLKNNEHLRTSWSYLIFFQGLSLNAQELNSEH